MRVLYSQLKQLVPGLKASPKQVGDKFAMAGFLLDGLKEVIFQGKKDWLLSFEVRQNRADCLGIVGLAEEAAAFYGLKCQLPETGVLPKTGKAVFALVEAKTAIKRALAVEIQGVKNKQSPSWLKEFLSFYDINSINLLVDLSNYAMIFTGYPSHLLDKNKISGSLCWAQNKNFKEIITLDATKIALKGGEIILKDDKHILGLAGIVGGRQAMIDLKTKNLIVEMAIYERAKIRRDSRARKITTEASVRLEKDLSAEGLDYVMGFLTSLILKEAGGKMPSCPLFSFYPHKQTMPKIRFNPELPSVFAGIPIAQNKCFQILKNLRFRVKKLSKNSWQVVPPLDRMDITIGQDLIEEILRVFGFERIPTDELPVFPVVKTITPLDFELAEKANDILTILGFDEIRSWTLTTMEMNLKTNWIGWQNIATENSVNEEFPDLRQSIAASLILELREYDKRNVAKIRIFEIGRVFGRVQNNFQEKEMLGFLIKGKDALQNCKMAVETLLRSLGFRQVGYLPVKAKPLAASPNSCWNILANNKVIGIIYQLGQTEVKEAAFVEIDLSLIGKFLAGLATNPVVELDNKLVSLDANIELGQKGDLRALLTKIEADIGQNYLWALEIVDSFPLKGKIRYTVKATYKNLSDKKAKVIHLKVFNLI